MVNVNHSWWMGYCVKSSMLSTCNMTYGDQGAQIGIGKIQFGKLTRWKVRKMNMYPYGKMYKNIQVNMLQKWW